MRFQDSAFVQRRHAAPASTASELSEAVEQAPAHAAGMPHSKLPNNSMALASPTPFLTVLLRALAVWTT